MKKNLVSVIIPTYNNERTITNCLISIKNQVYKEIELIVIDNNSDDKTQEIAKKFADKLIIRSTTPSEARNIGILNSKGDCILSIDSDMILEQTVIEECVSKINDYDALVIPEKSIGENFWADCKAFERSFYIGNPLVESPRFFRKTALKQVGYFDPTILFGEDMDTRNKLEAGNFRINRINSIIKHDEGKLSFKKIWFKYKHYGYTALDYSKKYPGKSKKQLGYFRIIQFLKRWKELLKHPILTTGFILLKSVECLAFQYGGWLRKWKSV